MDALHLEHMLQAAFSSHQQRWERWTTASFRISSIVEDPGIFMVDMQQVGRLDCQLLELERTMAIALATQTPMLTLDFHMVLSRCWVGLAYEVMRALNQRARGVPRPPEFDKAFHRLELVRIPEFKREVAQGKKLDHELFLTPVPPGEDQPMPYVHEQTVLNIPKQMDASTGSVIWHVYDVRARAGVELRRQELASELLAALELIPLRKPGHEVPA